MELEVLKGLIWSVTPIAAGLAIYQVFSFLDRNASPEAASTIADLLKEKRLFRWLTAGNREDVAAAIRELFDRIHVPRLPARDGTYARGPYWKELATWRT